MLNHTKKIKIKYNREATALLSALNGKYTKEILKIQRKKSRSRIFHIFAQKTRGTPGHGVRVHLSIPQF